MSRRAPFSARLRLVLLAVLTALATLLSPVALASASGLPAGQTRVGAIHPTVSTIVGVAEHIAAGQRRSRAASQLRLVVGHCVAAEAGTSGGAAAVRLGQAGEDTVRGAYDIGPKATIEINGRTRSLDGLNSDAVTEVKNVGYQAYTQQLKDSLAYAEQEGRYFDLYVRSGGGTRLSGPLEDAIAGDPRFRLMYIP